MFQVAFFLPAVCREWGLTRIAQALCHAVDGEVDQVDQLRVARVLAQAGEQGYLKPVERVQVGNAQGEGAGEAAVVGQQLVVPGQLQQGAAAAFELACNALKHGLGGLGLVGQVDVGAGDVQIRFGHHLLHIGEHGLEEGAVPHHMAQAF